MFKSKKTHLIQKATIAITLLLALLFNNPMVANATSTVLNTTFESNKGTGPDNYVYIAKMQTDGKVLIGGRISSYNGVTTGEFTRVNTDGSLDTAFNNNVQAGGTGGLNSGGYVYWIDYQADGKILVSGAFTQYGSNPMNRLIRFNSDGTPDTTFNTNIGTGFDSYVFRVDKLANGKVLAAGAFVDFNGTTTTGLVQLNTDGTLDTAFMANLGAGFAGGNPQGYVEQSDGKVVIIGSFTSFNNVPVGGIIRLNADGTVDNTFSSGVGFDNGGASRVAVQADGKLVVTGYFTAYNNVSVGGVVRLSATGTLDTAFLGNVSTTPTNIISVAIQDDQKILIGGGFSSFNGTNVNKLVRLNPDGTTDTAFVSDLQNGFADGSSKTLDSVEVYPDGTILVGSRSSQFNGVSNTHYLVELTTVISGGGGGGGGSSGGGCSTQYTTVGTTTYATSCGVTRMLENNTPTILITPEQAAQNASIYSGKSSTGSSWSNSTPTNSASGTNGTGNNITITSSVTVNPGTTVQVISAGPVCAPYLNSYIKYGQKNNPVDVSKLQVFLNKFQGTKLTVDGKYKLADFNAVKAFQAAHNEVLSTWGITKPTGYVYSETKRVINKMYCNSLGIK